MENAKSFDVFPLGEDNRCMISTNCKETQRNNNILVIGGTGSGKTRSVLQPILLHLESGNAVVVFTKRGQMEKSAAFLRGKGYNVQYIDFGDPSNSPYGYDPLVHCQNRMDVKSLAHAIIHSAPGDVFNDSFWPDSAENLLNAILSYVWDGRYERGRTMKDALELLDLLQWPIALERDVDEIKAEMRKKPADTSVHFRWSEERGAYFRARSENPQKATCRKSAIGKPTSSFFLRKSFEKLKKQSIADNSVWKSFLALPDSTGACVAGAVQTPLQNLFTLEVRGMLENRKQFSFENLLAPKTVLFLHISPANPAMHRFVGIFYQQLFKRMFELAEEQPDNTLPYPIHVLCDDFATGCRIQEFPEQISIFREKNISAVMLIQSLSQLAAMYGPMGSTTIVNNCDTIIYLGGMDLATCMEMSQRANRPVDEFLSMPIGAEYMFRRGERPIQTRRYSVDKDSLYKEVMRQQEKEPCADVEQDFTKMSPKEEKLAAEPI